MKFKIGDKVIVKNYKNIYNGKIDEIISIPNLGILKYNQFINENINSDIDPLGEENWDDNRFKIKKFKNKKGDIYYFAIHIKGDGDFVFSLGDVFVNGFSFSFYPAPLFPWSPISNFEKEHIFNDILKINIFEVNFSDDNKPDKVDIIKMTFTELCNTFKVNKEEFGF